MQSFFVVSGENVELAKDELVSISTSYDKNTSHETDSKLVLIDSSIPWDKIAQRATFVRTAGKIVDTFSDLLDRKSTRLNSSHSAKSRMPSSA